MGDDDALSALLDEHEWTYAELRAVCDGLSDAQGDYQGIPVPLDLLELRLCEGHPMRPMFDRMHAELRESGEWRGREERRCSTADVDESGDRIVNAWIDRRRGRQVLVIQTPEGRARAETVPLAPDRSMERLTMALMTLGAADAWDLDAEARALDKLASHVGERQLHQYLLTGSFLETSPRSRLTYLFRRLRPTVAMTSRGRWWWRDSEAMRCIAVLCMHPVGFYAETWAGCMVPTDDVLAHLLFMRADEAGFWRRANHHDPAEPEAGL